MSHWLDLTQPLSADVAKMPFLPAPRFEVIHELDEHKPQVSQMTVCTHVGTHIDAPSHFVRHGKNIGDYPVHHFIRRATIWSVKVTELEPITLAHLDGLEVQPGDALLLDTGWAKLAKDPAYYQHPYLADEVATWCVERKLSLVGMDFLTPDMPPPLRDESFRYFAHRTLLGSEVLIIENLANMQDLAGQGVELYAPPLRIDGRADAAQARVFARPLKH